MVIYNFYRKGIAVFPLENNAPLVIDSDTILTFPVSLERFQSIPRRLFQVLKSMGIGDHPKFPTGNSLDLIW